MMANRYHDRRPCDFCNWQASLGFPSAESYKQSTVQANVISVSDSFFGLAFAFELVLQLGAHGPREYYKDPQSAAEFAVVVLFGFQSAVEAGGNQLPFNPFVIRLFRLV
jgi:hypothetical protein